MFLNPLSATEVADTTMMGKVSAMVNTVGNMSTDELTTWAITNSVSVVSKIAIALAFYLVCRWLIAKLVAIINKMTDKRGVDVSLGKFLASMASISLNLLVILTTVGILGIDTTSFIAIFASAGLAVGMALSGTLQNFAGGVLILFLKPFKVGDFIEAQGFSGTVKEISLFSTLLNTVDNKMIIIPNGSLSNNSINNYSKESTRSVSWVFGVAYGTDISKATDILNTLLDENEFVLQDSPRVVEITALSSSSVDIVVRAWCESANYWALCHSMNRRVYDTFNAQGVVFPFNQLDVNIKN
ncbi:MAG: mechanosensitive ion channel domain-containing protein [Rikenellaceae bacterium]